MKSKTFFILIGVCAILAAICTYILSVPGKTTVKPAAEEEKFLSDLPVNEVASVTITGPDGQVVLEKGQSVWEVKNRFSYPANFTKIAEFVKTLKDLKVGRTFAGSEETKNRLALFPPEQEKIAKENKGTKVVLADKAKKVLAEVIIGKPREGSAGFGGQYLMLAKSDTVYLVDKELRDINPQGAQWINIDLMDVQADAVQEVICTSAKGETQQPVYALKREKKGENPKFVNPPEGKKVLDSKINSVFGALSSLKIDDVADPALKPEDTGIGSGSCIKFSLFDGTVYTACPGKAVKDDPEKFYLTLKAAYVEPPKPAGETPKPDAEPGKQVPEVPKPEPAKSGTDTATGTQESKPDTAKLAAQADELNKKIGSWTFILTKWKMERLTTDPEAFFEKPKPPEPQPEEGTMPEPMRPTPKKPGK
jgi:hypothetical protein